ncbi:flagellar hook-length control protein FliK [Acetobacterium wieringae]|uniref:Flagellar hook-length control protein FliK n=1 Tax=Acetobacterium wieringae TaxID=52694 RepID=A0ABY6HK53_9FIRM|nr:flagellar hook-length control protein FliK [Acetobacterium wieringae]UYO63799.1 flagellar hook-length control protein FliK [Acetobacterium wieringae]
MAGLRGMSGPENPSTSQSSGHENSAQFKDLLNQSKQTINQADHHLEKVRKNQREAKSIAENNRRQSDQTSLKDDAVTTADDQVEEPKEAELKSDEGQQSSSLSTLDSAQLMAIQSFQGGIETALTRLNLKLGIQGVEEPETGSDQGQMLTVTTESSQPLLSPALEGMTPFEEIGEEVTPVVVQNSEGLNDGTVFQIKGEPELQKTVGSELDLVDVTTNRRNPDQELVSQSIKVEGSDSQIVSHSQPLENKSEVAVDGVNKAVLTEESETDQFELTDVQTNQINQTEKQSLGENGVQEIDMATVNTNKSADVQVTNKTEVAQQVQQKILQNFEPNKPMVFQMTLSPDNLGDIDVKLSYDQGKLVIDILAVSQETQKLLGNQINQLVKGLALQNVQVETVHLNTPVEQSSDSQDATFMMNNGSDPNQNQNQALLRERFIKNSGVMNSITTNGDEDESVLIPQNLQNYTNHRINYLI